MARAAPRKWLPLFEEFIGDIRIQSKHKTSTDGRGVPLELWESQRRFLREVATGLDQGQKIFKCLKSRQLGVTTVSLAIDIFWAAMHPGITMAIVTDNEANRDKNRVVLKQYVNSFPDGYFGEDFRIVGDNRAQMRFSNGSRFDFKVAGTKDKGSSWAEGEGYAAAHLTEISNYGSAMGLRSFEEAFSLSNPDAIYLYESTAKGHNIWFDTYMSGFKDPHIQRPFFIGWWANPTNALAYDNPQFQLYGHDSPDKEEKELIAQVKDQYGWTVTKDQLAWYRYRQHIADSNGGSLDENQPWTAKQAFVMSGQSFFNTRLVNADRQTIEDGGENYGYLAYYYTFGNTFFDMKLHLIGDDEEVGPDDIELRIWEEPVPDGKYVIGCDPAYGRNDHKDRSCVSVWRCYADRIVQVAEFASHEIEVSSVAWVLAHLAGSYSDCIVNLELGGPGRIIMNEWSHITQLINSETYAEQVKRGEWEDALSNARWYLYNRPDSMGAGYAYNFETTWRNKQELMHAMRSAHINRELGIRSIPMLSEMMNVVQDGSTIGAPESTNPEDKDDRVFAAGFAMRAWINWRRSEMLSQGETYEVVTGRESGATTTQSRSLNGLVTRYFAWQAALDDADPVDDTPQWRVDRGLI